MNGDKAAVLEEHLKNLKLSDEQLEDVCKRLEKEFVGGLKGEKAPVKMLPTFITDTANGTESGDFLALDLGGTNLRLLHVQLSENKIEIKNKTVEQKIQTEIMEGPGDQLFDFISERLEALMETEEPMEPPPVGFTFSFPCEQKQIDECVLTRWTKGFTCSGVEGEDVVQLLKKAVDKKGLGIGPVFVVNDTVATMLSCSYEKGSCDVGVIIGTGTNACYMEEMRNVERVEGEDGRMCINTEWGGFGDDGSLDDIRTEFDKMVDELSINRNRQIFEKMISGNYLGEIVRQVLLELTKKNLIFKGQTLTKLDEPQSFKTMFISDIEHPVHGVERTQNILETFELGGDPGDVAAVRLVCETISTRSAHLCAAAMATIVNRILKNSGKEKLQVSVAVDGAVYRKHPTFKDKLVEKVRGLAPNCDVTFHDSDGGSGTGAAVAAAVCQRLNRFH